MYRSATAISRGLVPRMAYSLCFGSLSPLTLSSASQVRKLSVSTSISAAQHDPSSTPTPSHKRSSTSRWKPMCLYHTHGKCNMLNDPAHLEKFSHSCSEEFKVDISEFVNKQRQKFDYFLVLDLEGKVEILEFPVVLVDAETTRVVDLFHRFVRPSKMSEQRIDEYIEGKYGKLGVDRVWHDTAIPFEEVLQQFEVWLTQHRLWGKELGGHLNRSAFVTCGNWDVKTKIPQQCNVSKMKLPSYFIEWINLKDIYLNFYKRRATGMMTMMRELQIPSLGSHHLGIDDAKNITRVLQRMLADGARVQITARRNSPEDVEFLFKNRIR
uniref:Polynucleotidyl transferase ribonuclease H-like superfamily protein n=1 Tax=California macrophylla TaxID=337344 RepID=A0A0G4ALR5_9ROSI|nr:polynucleotidyl transferase ribonuclease H-like superfamily protein [California macrophylla]